VAAAVENSTRVDDHAWRMHLSGYHAFGLDFHAALGKNHAIKSARDHHTIPFDLALNPRAFAKDDGLFGDDVAFDISIDAKRPLELECALKRYALVDKARPLFTAAAVFCCAGPLPSHDKPPTDTSTLAAFRDKGKRGEI